MASVQIFILVADTTVTKVRTVCHFKELVLEKMIPSDNSHTPSSEHKLGIYIIAASKC